MIHQSRATVEDLVGVLRDVDLRIEMQELRRRREYLASPVAAVADPAHLPQSPATGDIALVVSTGEWYRADASQNWVKDPSAAIP